LNCRVLGSRGGIPTPTEVEQLRRGRLLNLKNGATPPADQLLR